MKHHNFTHFKAILLLTIILSGIFSAQAQDDRKFRFGLKGATSLGWMKVDNPDMERDGIALGYSYGVMGEIRLADNYSLSVGLDASNIGGKISYLKDTLRNPTLEKGDTTTYFKAVSNKRYNLGYIDIPIALKMKTNEIGYLTYFGKVGTTLGINYKARTNVEYPDNSTLVDNPGELKDVNEGDQIGLFRASLLVEGGVEINLTGNTNVMISLSLDNMFHNVFYSIGGDKELLNTVEYSDAAEIEPFKADAITKGARKKAKARYIALNVGIFF